MKLLSIIMKHVCMLHISIKQSKNIYYAPLFHSLKLSTRLNNHNMQLFHPTQLSRSRLLLIGKRLCLTFESYENIRFLNCPCRPTNIGKLKTLSKVRVSLIMMLLAVIMIKRMTRTQSKQTIVHNLQPFKSSSSSRWLHQKSQQKIF